MLLLIFISALLTILSYHSMQESWMPGVYFFKPLTTILIIALAYSKRQNLISEKKSSESIRYSSKILFGLVASLAGDIALMWNREVFFLLGMSFFLITHFFYISALWRKANPFHLKQFIPLVVLLGGGIAVFFVLAPNLGDLTFPVLIYLLVLLTMAWRALLTTQNAEWGLFQKKAVALASIFFVFSDLILSINQFYYPIALDKLGILSLYYASQTLFALSLSSSK